MLGRHEADEHSEPVTMFSKSRFRSFRQALAPLLRPVLEHGGPLRYVAAKVLAGRQPSSVEVDGLRFDVHAGDFGVTLELIAAGAYEPGSQQVMLDRLPQGGCFVDIGAHVGLFALPAARKVGPSGRVFAFEPNPENRALLEANVVRNGMEGIVEVVPCAVGDAAGTAVLHCSAWNTGDHRLFGAPRGRRRVDVEVVRLDEFLGARGCRADMIKIDVQGAEARVIAGLGVPDPLPVLLMEYSPSMVVDAGDDPEALLQGLVDSGWALSMVDEGSGSLTPGSVADVVKRCPHHAYVNLLIEGVSDA